MLLGAGLLAWIAAATIALAQPALPEGLDEADDGPGPALPEGLGGEQGDGGPTLPEGLDEAATAQDDPAADGAIDEPALPFDLSGFAEFRIGPYIEHAPHQRDLAIAETRLQLELEKSFDAFTAHLTTDLVYDFVAYSRQVDLESGEGWVDLREAWVAFTPVDFVDMKLGRQILTWGTGDLVFVNDLFPKDWNAFLIGRDVEYLKAPSDAIKASVFPDVVNLDLVYTPAFDADRFVDGRRVNYFDPFGGTTVGRNDIREVDRPNGWFEDDEIAARLYRRVGAWELAGYFYHGYWKSPMGVDPVTRRGTFPPLTSYGASLRGPVAEGIFNAEFAWYDSRDDRAGDDPFTPNSELRFLVGYERELVANFTVGVQYYLEHMLDHDAYRRTLPGGLPGRDENRHLLTVRLTLLTMMQNLEWSLFAFYSPSDDDAYLRPKVHYKIDDHWSAEVGANVFFGEHEHTFFGQFRDLSNVYAALRYAF